MKTWTLVVEPSDAGRRLDTILAERLRQEGSRAAWQRAIQAGHVLVNGRAATRSHACVHAGDRIEASYEAPVGPDVQPEAIPLRVVYEDDAVLVVDKPAGLVVHPAPGHPGGTLVNALLHHTTQLAAGGGAARPGIVHRLDRDTSGVMLVAKTEQAHRVLSAQFQDRSIRRVYLAVVKGRMEFDEGEIALPLGRSQVHRQKIAVRWESPRDAITRYAVQERLAQATVVRLFPHTGRTHQLRVHMAYVGHPILGDASYGGRAPADWDVQRQLLHATELGFRHPVSGELVTVQAPVPEEFGRVIERLRRMQAKGGTG